MKHKFLTIGLCLAVIIIAVVVIHDVRARNVSKKVAQELKSAQPSNHELIGKSFKALAENKPWLPLSSMSVKAGIGITPKEDWCDMVSERARYVYMTQDIDELIEMYGYWKESGCEEEW